MKRITSLVLCLLMVLTATACQKAQPREKIGGIRLESGEEVYPEPLLFFDSQEVLFDEFRYFYLNYKNLYLEENADYFKDGNNEKELKEEVLQCLLDRWAVLFLAKENRVRLSSDEKKAIELQIEETKAGYESEAVFLEELKKNGLSLSLYREMLTYSSLYLKVFDTLYRDGGKEAFTDEEFYAWFREHYLAVQQIYLPFVEGESENNCEQTKQTANSILEQAKNGTDFWTLVEQYGKDETMLSYPDGYYFTQGQAETELYEASKALAIGAVSDPVITSSGIYLIKRMELRTLRMEENRESALFGYRDSADVWHGGAYDDAFYELYRARAKAIQVQYSDAWDKISTASVF